MANLAGLGGFLQGLAGGIQQSIDNRLKAQESENRRRQLEAFLQSQKAQMDATEQRLKLEKSQEDRLGRQLQLGEATHALRTAQFLMDDPSNRQAFNRVESGVGSPEDARIHRMIKGLQMQGMSLGGPSGDQVFEIMPSSPFATPPAQTPAKARAEPKAGGKGGDLVGGGGEEMQQRYTNDALNELTARTIGVSKYPKDELGNYIVPDALYDEKRMMVEQENARVGSNASVIQESVYRGQVQANEQRTAVKIYNLASERFQGSPLTFIGEAPSIDEEGNVVGWERVEPKDLRPGEHRLSLVTSEPIDASNVNDVARSFMDLMGELPDTEKHALARMAGRNVLQKIESALHPSLTSEGLAFRDKDDPGRVILHGLRSRPGTYKEGRGISPHMGIEDMVNVVEMVNMIRDLAPQDSGMPRFRIDTPQTDEEWSEALVAAWKPLIPAGPMSFVPVAAEIMRNYLYEMPGQGPYTAEAKRVIRSFLERNRDMLDEGMRIDPLTGLLQPAQRIINSEYRDLLRTLKSRVGAR